MINTLLELFPEERGVTIGCFMEDDQLRKQIEAFAEQHSGRCIDLRKCGLRAIPYGGEFFDLILLMDDAWVDDKKAVSGLEKALQKNRHLVHISSRFDAQALHATLDETGFSNFCTIESEGLNVNIMKKWFRL